MNGKLKKGEWYRFRVEGIGDDGRMLVRPEDGSLWRGTRPASPFWVGKESMFTPLERDDGVMSVRLEEGSEDTWEIQQQVGVSRPAHTSSQPDRTPKLRSPRRDTVCWRCGQALNTTENDRCRECGWLICDKCGSCRSPEYGDCSAPRYPAAGTSEVAGDVPWE